MKFNKTDDELLAEANAIDAAYAAADLFDARKRIEYLERVLKNLIMNVREDIPQEQGSSHLWDSVCDAEDALAGYDEE